MKHRPLVIGLCLWLVLLTITVGLVGLARITHPPLPLLIFSNTERGADVRTPALFAFAPDCPTVWGNCAERTQILLTGLHTSYPVVLWSPDGEFIAVRAHDARWLFYRAGCLLAAGSEAAEACPATTIEGDWGDLRFAWGADGSVIALPSRSGRELRIFTRGCWDGSPSAACASWSVTTTNPDGSSFPLTLPDWSADGRWLAFSEGVTGAVVWMRAACLDAPDTCYEQLGNRIEMGAQAYWVTLSDDGDTALYFAPENRSISRSQIYQYRLRTGEKRRLSAIGEEAAVFDWSSDERFLAYSEGDGDQIDLMLLDMVRGVRVRAIRNSGWNLYPAWGVPSA